MSEQDWPHQTRGLNDIDVAVQDGYRAIVGVAPPGAGKSRMMLRLAVEAVESGKRAIIYLHRAMLLEQLSEVMREAGIDHGILASGYNDDVSKPLQLAMASTVYSRVVKRGSWTLPKSDLVIFDEAHQQTSRQAIALVHGSIKDSMITEGHLTDGDCTVIGFTGTPVNCGNLYDAMVGFGTYKELRDCKAHLPVRVYSPSEISTKGLKTNSENEYSERDIEPRAAMIVGSAYEGWKRLNPDAYPAILFGPSVEGARWFCHQWMRRGVKAAHIDGEICLMPTCQNGHWRLEQVPTGPDVRAEVMRMSKAGEIALVTNRFVLREAIDMPWLFHGIGATVYGAESSYLQSVGRIQRYVDEYKHKIWQDHGGSYWRHGSPNMERDWNLGDTNKSRARVRIARSKRADRPEDIEGIQCPKCNGWRTGGTACPHCNHSHKRSVRPVIELSGELTLQAGAVHKFKKSAKTQDKIWVSVLFAMAHSNKPVSSAVGVWYARCKSAGIEFPNASELKYKPPIKTDPQWHMEVGKVFPWLAKK